MNNRNSRYTTSRTIEIDTLSRPSPSTVGPAATSKAAGRINAIAASVSIVAWARAPAGLKCCSGYRIPPASMAAPSTSRILPIMQPAIDASTTSWSPARNAARAIIELGGIAECRIEQSANPFAHALRKMLGGPAHPSSERHNSKGGGNENEEIPFRSEQLLPNRHRNQQQEPVHHHGSAPTFEGLRSFRSICSTCHGSRQRRTIKSLVASSVDRMPHTAHMVTRVYINASP